MKLHRTERLRAVADALVAAIVGVKEPLNFFLGITSLRSYQLYLRGNFIEGQIINFHSLQRLTKTNWVGVFFEHAN